MARYVALFGSINVGGNRLTMADLRSAFEAEGFSNVETVVASGNVLFDHDARPTRGLEEKLSIMVDERFDMTSAALVRDRDELAAAIADNPFAGTNEDRIVHTMFLDGQPAAEQFDALATDHRVRPNERLALGDRALYIDFGDGAADSKLHARLIERRLGHKGTARNMRSIARIIAKLDEEAKG
ncbi:MULTISPECIES: DUF1697 domain-containing protein [unclassified Sphingopyxis]|uniref:DUF1697 domain-containing protein n=1 Tax=unclassified Sphingopyxis TaxID=2614943 RepID=UPI0028665AEF|nr:MULTISPECIES: DUF1697 domain-containing protein [unclassified Sphingopyxis]MDR7060661.1 uncharacterized protein (DUF1697 family) [Sphingopyxis sp. BE235]MDR7181118.1 uncharacterized protein (DUF1697 family) [Sphingopyxis sp. BE249]